MNLERLLLSQLDASLTQWNAAKQEPVPRIGWVKLIRKALGLSSYQLAKRMRVSQSRVVQIESGEINGSVTLKALQHAAASMDCQLIYAIVPHRTTLQDILKKRAEKLAKKRLKRVAHSMMLEAQEISESKQQKQFKILVKELLEGPFKKLWGED